VLWEILNIEQAEKLLKKSKAQREIPYVVVVPDMRAALRIMAIIGASNVKKCISLRRLG